MSNNLSDSLFIMVYVLKAFLSTWGKNAIFTEITKILNLSSSVLV